MLLRVTSKVFNGLLTRRSISNIDYPIKALPSILALSNVLKVYFLMTQLLHI